MLSGKWTHRSGRNDRPLIGDHPQKALALVFGGRAFDFVGDGPNGFAGTLDTDGGRRSRNRVGQVPASSIAVAQAAA